MFGPTSATASYQIKQQQARCLVALEGDTDRNRFVVGSLDLAAGGGGGQGAQG